MSLRSLLFVILFLFVDFSGAENIVVHAGDSHISSNPVWTTSNICPNSHYLNISGDEVSLQFVSTLVKINFETANFKNTNAVLALISINNTDVDRFNTARNPRCSPLSWSSGALPPGRHTLRVTQMSNSDHVYIRSFSYTSMPSPPSQELKCYGLPYGGLGFLSHILAIYTFMCLIYRRKAFFPWISIKPGKHISDMILSLITFVATLTLTSITMARCKNNWQYILLAVENLCLSTAISAISLSSSLDTPMGSHAILSYVMCAFTFIGGIVGDVGYISLIMQNWSANKNVQIAVFGSILGGTLGFGCVLGAFARCYEQFPDYLSYMIFSHLFGISMADWVLGAIAGNISGIPHGTVAVLIWLYFVIQNLPMLAS